MNKPLDNERISALYDVICISSIDWDFMWQSHQEIMSRLAAQGHRVLFIENTGTRALRLRDLSRLWGRVRNWRRGLYGIHQERDSLFVFSPLVIPWPYARFAVWINRQILLFVIRRWMKAMGFVQPIIWTFLPTRLTLALADWIDHRLLVYYCADRFAAASPAARKIQRTETQLLRRADLVFATSQALVDHCAQVSAKVHRFPAGVNLQVFDPTIPRRVPTELAGLKHPVIGYVGGVHQWVDLPLLRSLALARPDYSFVLVGPVQTSVEPLRELPNVLLIGQRSHQELPNYIQHFDVGMVPYRLTDYTRHVYPSKLNEYFACGKPVVSTPLPEITTVNQQFGGVVEVGQDANEFCQALERILHRQNGEIVQQRRRAAQANSWDVRVEQMVQLIDKAVEETWHQRECRWRQTLVQLAHRTWVRFQLIAWPVALGYLLLFRVPLIWWVAQPLKIAEPPQRADAIVIFAGGVGESGQAGQGYQERVQHAVALYQQGYAPVLMFSSGYRQALKEIQVMKALAVSLGVPMDAILLEEEAANTNENVRFSAALLRQHGYRSALVVSSPYHMRRASLVWRKAASDLEPTWSPVPYSHFFGNHRKIELQHWEAILHEYLGILYYWWKGWI